MTRIKLPHIHEYSDRLGKLRRYVRRPGCRSVALPGQPGSEEFMDAYHAAIAMDAPAPKPRERKEGTVDALVMRFLRSAEFSNLKPRSQRVYRIVIERFAKADGHRMAHDMPVEKARKIVEEIGTAHPGMANLTHSVLRRLFKFNGGASNPFVVVTRYKLGTHHTWTDDQLAAYEAHWALSTRERLAFDVLLYTAQRVGDAARMTRAEARKGAFRVVQEKTGAKLEIGVHPTLAASIKSTPAKGLNLLGDQDGRPMTGGQLSKLIAAAVKVAGLPAECVAHGLRKAAMRRLAEHGSTAHEIQAVSGHKTLSEVSRYTEKAEQAKLARSAMSKLPNRKETPRG